MLLCFFLRGRHWSPRFGGFLNLMPVGEDIILPTCLTQSHKKPSLAREGGRQIVKSSATLFRNEINRRKIIETFTRTSIDKINHS